MNRGRKDTKLVIEEVNDDEGEEGERSKLADCTDLYSAA